MPTQNLQKNPNISYPLIRIMRIRWQEMSVFLENFAYVLNTWPLTLQKSFGNKGYRHGCSVRVFLRFHWTPREGCFSKGKMESFLLIVTYSKCDLVFNPSLPDRVRREKINLKSDSHLPKKFTLKNLHYLLQWKPFKIDEKCVLFHF